MSELLEYFVRHYTLVLDNDQGSYEVIVHHVNSVIRNSGITGVEWLALSTEERNERFASDIGGVILDQIEEYIDEAGVPDASESIGAALVREILYTTGSDLAWALGKHYMPEDADIVDLLDAESDDDDEE